MVLYINEKIYIFAQLAKAKVLLLLQHGYGGQAHAVGGRVLHPAEAVADDAGVVQLHDRAALPRVVVDAAEPEGALRFLVVDLHREREREGRDAGRRSA
jgi:hypothetical protein